jgi:hypothetical protein
MQIRFSVRDSSVAFLLPCCLTGAQMNSGGFRHLPVRDRTSNRTIGLISIGDLVRTMMKDYADKNSYLEDLVSGKYPA